MRDNTHVKMLLVFFLVTYKMSYDFVNILEKCVVNFLDLMSYLLIIAY